MKIAAGRISLAAVDTLANLAPASSTADRRSVRSTSWLQYGKGPGPCRCPDQGIQRASPAQCTSEQPPGERSLHCPLQATALLLQLDSPPYGGGDPQLRNDAHREAQPAALICCLVQVCDKPFKFKLSWGSEAGTHENSGRCGSLWACESVVGAPGCRAVAKNNAVQKPQHTRNQRRVLLHKGRGEHTCTRCKKGPADHKTVENQAL